MSDMRKARLEIEHFGDEAKIRELAAGIGAPGWMVTESYPKLTFAAWRPGEPFPALGEEFAGCLFGPEAELRWTRDGSGFHLWRYRESAEGKRYLASKSRYYCAGFWRDGRFWESSLPREIEYPVPAGTVPEDQDRPYVTAVEYWTDRPDAWPNKVQDVEEILNQPRLAAYRLTGLSFGKDPARSKPCPIQSAE
jgi:hypothetical protein